MIIIKVELHSAVTGKITELARMMIVNDGKGSYNNMNYDGVSYRGRDAKTLDKNTVIKSGRIENWPSERFHIWNLISKMLLDMGYKQGH